MNRGRVLVTVLLALVLVLSGCSGTASDPSTDAPTSTAAPTPTGPSAGADHTTTRSPTRTATPTPTETEPKTPSATPTPAAPTTTPTPDTPWGKRELVVNLSRTSSAPPFARAAIDDAVAYWNRNVAYSAFDVTLTFEPDAEEADVFIEFTDCIGSDVVCDSPTLESRTLGDAPLVRPGDRIDPHAHVRITYDDDRKFVTQTIQHELGHVLGIAHNESPMPLMAPDTIYNHAAPWDRSNLTVYVDYSDKPGIAASEYDYQIERALEYYEEGAGGWIDPAPEYTRVESKADANVLIELHDDEERDLNGESAEVYVREGQVGGRYYKRFTVLLVPWDVDSTGWRVGYYLAYSFNNQSTDRLPCPFVDPTYDSVRSQWWNHADAAC